MEKWLPSPAGTHEVSDQGRVRGVDRVVMRKNGSPMTVRGKMMTPQLRPDGYWMVYADGKMWYVCRLVLTVFVSPKPPGMEACHGPGGKADDRLSNLCWGTRSRNALDMVLDGTHNNARKTRCKRNHEFTPENTRIRRDDGGRECRQCQRERAAA